MLINNTPLRYSYLLMHQSLKDEVINTQNSIKIGEYVLHYSSDLDLTVYKNDDIQIISLGYVLDIRNGLLRDDEILSNLSNSVDIDRELDYINGRYVLIVNEKETTTVYTDASALLPINYSSDKSLIASHDILIKEVLEHNGTKVSDTIPELKGAFDFTRYESIYKFNPSLKLDLKTGEFKRYYPTRQLVNKSIDSIIKELEVYFEEMNKWLNNWKNDIVLTLTGGYDSRVSMALTKDFNKRIEYLTYLHPNLDRLNKRAKEIYDIDLFITENIASNLNVNHTMVDLSAFNLEGEEREHALKTLQTAHSFSLIDYFRNERKFNKSLHIKSTVFGMGKSDFPLNKNHEPATYEEMTEFIHGVSDEAKKRPDYEEIVSEYYKRNLHKENVGLGRHYFEIFHLESRMGNWHSNVTQETDPEMLEFIYVNSRRIIDLLQSPTIQERRDKILYKRIIKKYWPALLFIGFNEKSFNIDYNKMDMNAVYFKGLKVYEILNLAHEVESEDAILIKPESEQVGPQTQYVFKAKNNTNLIKSITIKSFFNKENARHYIDVSIMKTGDKKTVKMDIVKLNDGYNISVAPFEEFMIEINYNNLFDKTSWQQAGRILIEGI